VLKIIDIEESDADIDIRILAALEGRQEIFFEEAAVINAGQGVGDEGNVVVFNEIAKDGPLIAIENESIGDIFDFLFHAIAAIDAEIARLDPQDALIQKIDLVVLTFALKGSHRGAVFAAFVPSKQFVAIGDSVHFRRREKDFAFGGGNQTHDVVITGDDFYLLFDFLLREVLFHDFT
jgi:hypothetical protein